MASSDFISSNGSLTRRDLATSALGAALIAGPRDVSASEVLLADWNRHDAASIRTFGAVGDGQHDDTAAIRDAIAHCATSGSALHIPVGTFVITDSLVINTAVGFTIFGDGYASCIRPQAGGTYIPFFVQRNDFAATVGMHFRNFRIDANGTGQLDTGVITLNGAVGGSVTQLWLENGTRRRGTSGQNGISCSSGDAGGAGPAVIISGNVIRNFSKAGINFTSGGVRAVITSNMIQDIAGNGTAPGIQVNGGRNAIIAHNHVTRTEGAGIYLTTDKLGHSSFSANVSHNIVEECGQSSLSQGDGILISSALRSDSYIIVEGNHLYGNGVPKNGGSGIRIENCDNALIAGNLCHHNNFDGIRVENCSFLQIMGNRCADNNLAGVKFAGGIQLRGSGTHINVTGNHLASKGSTQSYAIIADAAAELSFITIAGNHTSGNAEGSIFWQARGCPVDVETTLQRKTSGSAPTAVLLWRIDPSASCWITITITGRLHGLPQRSTYVRQVVYQMHEGALTQKVTPYADSIFNSAAWGGVTFDSSGGYAVARVSGAPDAEIEWIGTAVIRSV